MTGQHTGTLPAEQSTWHIYRKTPRAHQKETGTGGIVCPCFSCHHSICHSLHKTCNKAITLLLTSARTGCIFPDAVFSCRHTLPPLAPSEYSCSFFHRTIAGKSFFSDIGNKPLRFTAIRNRQFPTHDYQLRFHPPAYLIVGNCIPSAYIQNLFLRKKIYLCGKQNTKGKWTSMKFWLRRAKANLLTSWRI